MKKFIINSIQIFAIGFIINLIWENLHAQLYYGYSGFISFFWVCFKATFFDAFFVMSMYWLILIINKDIYFYKRKPKILDLLVIILTGITIALFIENRALNEGRWAYNEFMPLVYGVGLTPLIQLSATSIISLMILKRYNNN